MKYNYIFTPVGVPNFIIITLCVTRCSWQPTYMYVSFYLMFKKQNAHILVLLLNENKVFCVNKKSRIIAFGNIEEYVNYL
jgi:hypothetical protein